MARIRLIQHIDDEKNKYYHDQYIYWCLGCGYEHAFNPEVHKFNGSIEKPTVSPSLLHSNPQKYHTCHSFISDGKIQYLSDCWHQLAGQTIELPDIDEELEKRCQRNSTY
jgi:hypothetical protein